MDEDLEIKLDLPAVHPWRVAGSELAELLRDLESAVEAEAANEENVLTTRADSEIDAPLVSLVSVRDGSATYGFQIGFHVKDPATRAFRGLATGGAAWASVSPTTQKALTKTIERFTRRNIPVTLKSRLEGVPNVTFSTDNPPPAINLSMFAAAPATRSVEVIKAGGIRPTATVVLLGEGYRVPVQGPRKLIQELGRRLYQRAVITGTAHWRLTDWRLVMFKAEKVEAHPDADVGAILNEMSEITGDSLSRAGGVRGFLALNRDEGGEDE
jgi:hypothetical protein